MFFKSVAVWLPYLVFVTAKPASIPKKDNFFAQRRDISRRDLNGNAGGVDGMIFGNTLLVYFN